MDEIMSHEFDNEFNNEFNKELSHEEQLELFKLLIIRVLLSTKPEEWKSNPTEFVQLAVPKNLIDFLSDLSNSKIVLSGIITDMIIKGISSFAKEIGDPENLELMISLM